MSQVYKYLKEINNKQKLAESKCLSKMLDPGRIALMD